MYHFWIGVTLSLATQLSLNPTETFPDFEKTDSVVACKDQMAATIVSISSTASSFVFKNQSDAKAVCIFVGVTEAEVKELNNRVGQSKSDVLSITFVDDEAGLVYLPWPLIKKPD